MEGGSCKGSALTREEERQDEHSGGKPKQEANSNMNKETLRSSISLAVVVTSVCIVLA